MKNESKILVWILHEGSLSGANYALMEYFDILQELGFHLKVIAPSKGTFIELLMEKGFDVTIEPFYSWTRHLDQGYFIKGWLKRLLRNSYAVLKVLMISRNAHAICTNTICTNIGVVSSILLAKPHYLFVHEFGEEDHGFRLAFPTKKAYRFFNLFSKAIILNSKAVKLKWETILRNNNKLHVLFNCVNVKTINPKKRSKPNAKRFLMLGQISEGKGHEIAIDALHLISENHPDAELHIVGPIVNEDYYKYINQKIKHLTIKVFIKPPVKNPFLIFNDYLALLMCSRKEAFGRVTVEALKSGLPVIGLNSGGTAEIIEHGCNGYLVDLNRPEYFSFYMQQLITKEDKEYQEISTKSLEINEKYNTTASAQVLKTVLDTK